MLQNDNAEHRVQIVLGVAWPLIIEAPFYMLIVFLSPVLNSRRLALAVALGTVVVLLVLVVSRDFDASSFRSASSAAYLPVLRTDRATLRVATTLRGSTGISESALSTREMTTLCFVPT